MDRIGLCGQIRCTQSRQAVNQVKLRSYTSQAALVSRFLALCAPRFSWVLKCEVQSQHTYVHNVPGRQNTAMAAVVLQCPLDAALPTQTECTYEPRAKPEVCSPIAHSTHTHSRTDRVCARCSHVGHGTQSAL